MTNYKVKPISPAKDAPRSVLFVCRMNAIRSPMAAAITRTFFPNLIYSRSAGMMKGELDFLVNQVMEEVEVDISTHNPHTLEEMNEGNFELVIALTQEAYNHALSEWGTPESELELWETDDPSLAEGTREQRLDAYRAVRDVLYEKVKARLG